MNKIYSLRFAIVISLKFLLDGDIFNPEILNIISYINNNDYYVKMAIA